MVKVPRNSEYLCDGLHIVLRHKALFTVMLAVAAARRCAGTLAWLVSGGLAGAVGPAGLPPHDAIGNEMTKRTQPEKSNHFNARL
jgi:hypothetical protein